MSCADNIPRLNLADIPCMEFPNRYESVEDWREKMNYFSGKYQFAPFEVKRYSWIDSQKRLPRKLKKRLKKRIKREQAMARATEIATNIIENAIFAHMQSKFNENR